MCFNALKIYGEYLSIRGKNFYFWFCSCLGFDFAFDLVLVPVLFPFELKPEQAYK